jgi:DNA gyrase/topoisomerase IV subunit B
MIDCSTLAPLKLKLSKCGYMTLKRKSWSIGIILFESADFRDVRIVPGLYKIFDEILVNAADNKIRDPNMDHIKVIVDREKGSISIHNNGRGIPIEIHEVYPSNSDLIL